MIFDQTSSFTYKHLLSKVERNGLGNREEWVWGVGFGFRVEISRKIIKDFIGSGEEWSIFNENLLYYFFHS